MIFDASANLVVGNAGWVDKGALWTFDPARRVEKTITVEGARYLTLRAGANGLFRLFHHGGSDHAVSIRRVAESDLELSSVRISNAIAIFAGDMALWEHVDPVTIVATGSGQRLIKIDALRREGTDLNLAWYTNDTYDLGYQGLTDCMCVDSARVIVSVQRSSELVILDSNRNQRVGAISLANRGGNPILRMRTPNEFFASDYDTLCRVDVHSLAVLNCARLQDGGGNNMRQFIGDYDLGWGVCVVARPFSGDVLRLNPDSFEVLGRAQIGDQPLAVCLVAEDRFVTRDWKTGRASVGQFE